MRTFLQTCCVALAVLFVSATAFAAQEQEAAVVIAVTPGAFVERGGQKTPLELKSPIYASDVVVTDATGKAQLLFRDDTTVAVASNSSIRMDEFSFGGPEKAAFGMRMSQGVSRVVTGRVVEENREGFHIVTPHATVGIRGTILTTNVNAEGTRVVVAQIGAGHSVSIANSSTGQVSNVGKAGMTAVASPAGNEVRPSTAQERTEAQAAGRSGNTAVTASASQSASQPASQSSGQSTSQTGEAPSSSSAGAAADSPSVNKGMPSEGASSPASSAPNVTTGAPTGANIGHTLGAGGTASSSRLDALQQVAEKVAQEQARPDNPVRPGGKPSDDGNASGAGKPADPGTKPSEPGSTPSNPGDNPSDPDDNPSDPDDNPSDPDDNPSDPDDNPSDPGGNPSDPGDNPLDPGGNPPSGGGIKPELAGAYLGNLKGTGQGAKWGGNFSFRVGLTGEGGGQISDAKMGLWNYANDQLFAKDGSGELNGASFSINNFTGYGSELNTSKPIPDVTATMDGHLPGGGKAIIDSFSFSSKGNEKVRGNGAGDKVGP